VVSVGGSLKGHDGWGRGLFGSALFGQGVRHASHDRQWGVSGRNMGDTRGGMTREWWSSCKMAHRQAMWVGEAGSVRIGLA
jgi:hypothetical protein